MGIAERTRRDRRRLADEWRQLVAEQERSELSIRAFARSRGLNANTFAWWRARLRSRGASRTATTFVELRSTARPPAPSGDQLELQLRNGTILRIPAGFDVLAVASLVAALSC